MESTNLEIGRLPGLQCRGIFLFGWTDSAPAACMGPGTAMRTASAQRQTARRRPLKSESPAPAKLTLHVDVPPSANDFCNLGRRQGNLWRAIWGHVATKTETGHRGAAPLPRLCLETSSARHLCEHL